MDTSEHERWLTELAADDRRRRAQAEPELARKEALLRSERAKLAASEAAVAALEHGLEQARRDADEAADP